MRRFRRFAALLVLPLALQLVLAAKAVACVQQGGVATSASSPVDEQTTDPDATVAGMDMNGTGNANGTPSPSPHRSPCENPFGPGDCQPFAACGSAVVVPSAPVSASLALPDVRIDPLVALAPTSRTRAPEPPPPRV